MQVGLLSSMVMHASFTASVYSLVTSAARAHYGLLMQSWQQMTLFRCLWMFISVLAVRLVACKDGACHASFINKHGQFSLRIRGSASLQTVPVVRSAY